MQVYKSLEQIPRPESGCIVTVGNFDGVHVGHQAIFARAREIAAQEGLPVIGITFDPPPVKILRPERILRILTPQNIKIRLLEDQGLDQLLIIETTQDFLSLSQEEFVKNILVDRLAVRHIVEGQTFGFGRHRVGTTITLQQLGEKYGFEAHMVAAHRAELEQGTPIAVNST